MADLIAALAATAGGVAVESDDDFANTVLLLHGDGTDGTQNNTFLDSSTNNFTITRNGNTTQGSFSPFSKPDGRWGNYFDGSGDYLSNTSTALITQSVSTFTAEGWIYMTAAPTSDANGISGLMTLDGQPAGSVNYLSFGPLSSRVLYLRWFDGAGKTAIGSTTLNLNQWYHIACVVNSNAIQFYVNGVAESMSGTTTLTNRNGSAAQFGFGVNQYGAFSGYLSNARVTTTAVYTTGFTPSGPLTNISNTKVLTCQSNRFIDNSTNAYALTANGDVKVTPFSPFPITTEYSGNSGSGYFDGSGDTLTSATVGTTIGTGDWCLEFWVYETAAGSLSSFVQLNNSSGYNIYLQTNSGAARFLNFQNPGLDFVISGGTVPLNSWTHIVGTFQSGTARLFVNGVLVANQGSLTRNYGTAGTVQTGPTSTSYASDIRVTIGSVPTDYQTASTTNGTAVFAPPSAPLTTSSKGAASTDVDLLYNFTNAGIYDNTGFNNLETVGNAQIDTTTKKYGTGAMEFDGTGDYLKVQNPIPPTTFGSGDFTIEFWFNASATSTTMWLFDGRIATPADGAYPAIYINSSNNLIYYVNAAARITGSTALSTGTWYHIAVVRSSGTTKMYLDGVQEGSNYTDTTVYADCGAGRPAIGIATNIVQGFNGYIDDLRISRVARYTTTFTPPTKAFPNIGS